MRGITVISFSALAFGIMLLSGNITNAQQNILEPIEVGSGDGKREITAAVGQKLVLRMSTTVQNDCRWSIKEIDGGTLKILGTEYRKDENNPMLAYSLISFEGVKAGKSTVLLSLTSASNTGGRRFIDPRKFNIEIFAAAAYRKLGPQGCKGFVEELKGNFMPSPKPVDRRTGIGRGKPLSVPVYIFQGRVKVFKKPDPKHEQLIKIVQSGKNGKFKLDLPPGRYTAVAVIDGKMYLNLSSNAGTWSTFSVFKGKYTTITIRNTSHAAF